MIPLVVAAAAAAAASIASSAISANASSDAAAASAAQEQKALDFQKGVWTQTQANEAPYLKAGQAGLSDYQSKVNSATQPQFNYKLPDFNYSTQTDPGAIYRMDQATKAINNSSIAKGLGGGGAIKAIMSKNQDMAGQAYSDAWNRYLAKNQQDYGYANADYERNLNYQNTDIARSKDLMTQGANVAAGLGTTGVATGNQVGTSYGNIGQSQASGILGAGNAASRGIASGVNALGQAIGYGTAANDNQALKLQNIWAGGNGQSTDNLGVA